MKIERYHQNETNTTISETTTTTDEVISQIWVHMSSIREHHASGEGFESLSPCCQTDDVILNDIESNLNRLRRHLIGSGWIDMINKHGLSGMATYICSGFPNIFAR